MDSSHYCGIYQSRDKIIHLLYAGIILNYYNECVLECIETFGKKEVEEAILEFNDLYRKGIVTVLK